MPHLLTDAGNNLNLERTEDGTVTIEANLDTRNGGALITLTAGEARMVGAFLNPALTAPTTEAELRARAAHRGTYDPGKTFPTSWAELITYARHQSGRGLEVLVVTPVVVPDLLELNAYEGITYEVVEGTTPPGEVTVGRNGQRIAHHHLGATK